MDFLLFLTLGFAGAGISAVLRRFDFRFVAVGLFGTIGFYLVVSTPGRLTTTGAAVFSLGLGVALARWARRQPEHWFDSLRRTLLPLAACAFVVCVAAAGGDSVLEKFHVARLPDAPTARPNVLLIVLDTLRADRVGAYGYLRPTTPFLDEIAKQSVLFENVFANSSWTLPSHASLFTGRLPYEHAATMSALDTRFPTVAEAMAADGYATAAFVANKGACTEALGLDRGFHHWENLFTDTYDSFRRTTLGRKLEKHIKRRLGFDPPEIRMPTPEVTQRFMRWIDSRPQRPFFIFLNYMETHDPYEPPPEFAQRFRTVAAGNPAPNAANSQESDQKLIDSYDASVAYLDSQLREMFQELERRGLTRNLLVIITSDHGESLGENGLYAHRNSLYLAQLRVPLLIWYPGRVPSATRVPAVVGLERLPATLAHLALGTTHSFPNNSLVPLWSDGTEPPQAVISELDGDNWPGVPKHWPIHQGWLKSVITERWHFILQKDGKVELFEWPADLAETRNLAGTPDGKKVVEDLQARIGPALRAGLRE